MPMPTHGHLPRVNNNINHEPDVYRIPGYPNLVGWRDVMFLSGFFSADKDKDSGGAQGP